MRSVLNLDCGHGGLHSCIQLSKLIELSLLLAFFEFSGRLNFARLFLTAAVSDTKFKDLESCLTMQNQHSSSLHCESPSQNHRKFHKRWSSLFVLLWLVLQHKPLTLPSNTLLHVKPGLVVPKCLEDKVLTSWLIFLHRGPSPLLSTFLLIFKCLNQPFNRLCLSFCW